MYRDQSSSRECASLDREYNLIANERTPIDVEQAVPKRKAVVVEATRVIVHKTHLISTSAIFFPDLVILTAFEPADDDDDELPHKVHRP